MFMPSYLNPLPAYNGFATFTQSRKPNRGHLMRTQTKYQADFCHSGTYLLSCLSWMVLMESSKLPSCLINRHKAVCLFDSEKYPKIRFNLLV